MTEPDYSCGLAKGKGELDPSPEAVEERRIVREKMRANFEKYLKSEKYLQSLEPNKNE